MPVKIINGKAVVVDENDNPVFDNVLVLSDRIVLVNQLADTVKQFEKTEGVVTKVETSAELAKNLEKYKKIIKT